VELGICQEQSTGIVVDYVMLRGLPEIEWSRLTCGSCLNSAGERRSGTFADKLLVDILPLMDLAAELSGRAAVNITSGAYV